MKSTYRKEGRTLRLELDRYGAHRIETVERGEAIEGEKHFMCQSLEGSDGVPATVPRLPADLVDQLGELGKALERATVASGTSVHRIEEPRWERSWSDAQVRFHASIVNRELGLRCEIDRGSVQWENEWIPEVTRIIAALENAKGEIPEPKSVALEPAVTAAVVAELERWRPDGVALIQRPRPSEIDGRGRDLETVELTSPGDSRLGWFRPSYRIPPRRMPHGVDLRDAQREGADPVAEANVLSLLDPIQIEQDTLILRCLVSRGDESAGATTLRLDPRDVIGSMIGEPAWFPVVAGAWGRRAVVTGS